MVHEHWFGPSFHLIDPKTSETLKINSLFYKTVRILHKLWTRTHIKQTNGFDTYLVGLWSFGIRHQKVLKLFTRLKLVYLKVLSVNVSFLLACYLTIKLICIRFPKPTLLARLDVHVRPQRLLNLASSSNSASTFWFSISLFGSVNFHKFP